MKHARIVDGIAVEIVSWNPSGRYPADWAWVECPDTTVQGAAYDGETFTNPAAPDAGEPVPIYRTLVTPREFQRLFTHGERMAIDRARDQAVIDAISDDTQRETARELKRALDIFFGDLEDPQLEDVDVQHPDIALGLESVRAAGLIEDHRPAEIQQGWPL
jgi:hypothetical protein